MIDWLLKWRFLHIWVAATLCAVHPCIHDDMYAVYAVWKKSLSQAMEENLTVFTKLRDGLEICKSMQKVAHEAARNGTDDAKELMMDFVKNRRKYGDIVNKFEDEIDDVCARFSQAKCPRQDELLEKIAKLHARGVRFTTSRRRAKGWEAPIEEALNTLESEHLKAVKGNESLV